jgi:hypothetical protein
MIEHLPKELQRQIFSSVNIHGLFNLAGCNTKYLNLVNDYLQVETPEQLLAVVNKLSGLDALHVIKHFKQRFGDALSDKVFTQPEQLSAAEILCFVLTTDTMGHFRVEFPDPTYVWLHKAVQEYKAHLSPGMLENFNLMVLASEMKYHTALRKRRDPAYDTSIKDKFIQSLKQRKSTQYLSLGFVNVDISMTAEETLNLVGVNLSFSGIYVDLVNAKIDLLSPEVFSHPKLFQAELDHVAKVLPKSYTTIFTNYVYAEIMRKAVQYQVTDCLAVAIKHPLFKTFSHEQAEFDRCKRRIESRAAILISKP